MARAMGEKLRRQMRQIFGNIVEMGNANSQHNVASLNRFTVLELQNESPWQPS